MSNLPIGSVVFPAAPVTPSRFNMPVAAYSPLNRREYMTALLVSQAMNTPNRYLKDEEDILRMISGIIKTVDYTLKQLDETDATKATKK